MPAVAKLNAQMVGLLSTVFERCWACGVETVSTAYMANDGDATQIVITVVGARVGDPAVASHDSIGAQNVLITANVQGANAVRVILLNKTGGPVTVASGKITACVRVRYAI